MFCHIISSIMGQEKLFCLADLFVSPLADIFACFKQKLTNLDNVFQKTSLNS